MGTRHLQCPVCYKNKVVWENVCFVCSYWAANLPYERRQSHQQLPAAHHRCVVSQSGYHSQTPRDQLRTPSCVESTPQWPPVDLLSATEHPAQYAARGGWFARLQKLETIMEETTQLSCTVKAASAFLKFGRLLTRSFGSERRREISSFYLNKKEYVRKKVTPKSFSLLGNTGYSYTNP